MYENAYNVVSIEMRILIHYKMYNNISATVKI